MFFTQVSDAETFLIHVHVGEETLATCTGAQGVAGDDTLDLGEQLANRGSVPFSAVTHVELQLSPADAERLLAVMRVPMPVAIAWLWEDESPLGTYHLAGARPDGDVTGDDGTVVVTLAVDGLTFED